MAARIIAWIMPLGPHVRLRNYIIATCLCDQKLDMSGGAITVAGYKSSSNK
ncbi:hypothetical protein AG1IA_09148 [Rhizoctonia solani AG-1 IA]|uniref:Uncharacterized protein n=1 Tax=Thanatephorus cucumeris (strain AG1-IA) TaxID=983506 RepID=L8WJ51_THACA|nr:hypothetical protein AG1IA_09148 [Rhizoctonia solani AG-1 IA]